MTVREQKNLEKRLQRKSEIRRRVFLAIATVCIVLAVVLSVNVLNTTAGTDIDGVYYKYFTSFEISYGDTLWSIAERYKNEQFYDSTNEYIEEVVNMNHLSSTDLVAGQRIIIPYYSTEFVR